MSKSSAVTKDGARTAVMRCLRRLFTTAVALLFTAACLPLVRGASQFPPDLMTYQGFLTDGSGNTLAATTPLNFTVVFRIYNVSTGGSPLWTESQVVTVDKGNFSVLLGQGTAVGSEPHNGISTVFVGSDASDRYIEMTVTVSGTTSTISPRLHLVTAPYAALAKTATSLYNNDGSAVQNINGSFVTSGTVADGRLSSNVPLKNAQNNFSAWQTFSSGVTFSGQYISSTVDFSMPNNTLSVGTVNGNGTVPLGTIVMWYYDAIPSGWAKCDGGTYNGRGTPDLRDRFIVGAGNNYGIRWTGGASSVQLSVYNLPSHSHGYTDRFFIEAGTGNYGNGVGYYYAGSNLYGSHSSDNDNNYYEYINDNTYSCNNCNNNAFSIIPPYYALYFIMRVY